MVGGDYIGRNLDLLVVEGRLVQIAFLKSAKAELDFSVMMRKRLWITGSTLRPRIAGGEGRDRARAARAACGRCSKAAPWRRSFTRRFPLADAAAAHRLMEAGTHIGKLVLVAR